LKFESESAPLLFAPMWQYLKLWKGQKNEAEE